MALFSAYFDESYGEEDAYSVAGYVATVEQWAEFEREWNEMLAEFGVTFMHKSDLEHLIGEFKPWRSLQKPEQNALKKRLNQRAIGIIKRRVNAGFAGCVKKSDWESTDKGSFNDQIMGAGFYAAGAKTCMQLMSGWADEYKRETIDYLFESGADGAHELNGMLQAISRDPDRRRHYRLSTWGFGSGKPDKRDPTKPVIIPFQAADFLAYEVYKQIGNRVVSGLKINKEGKPIRVRGAYRELISSNRAAHTPTPHYMLYFDKEKIKVFTDVIDDLVAMRLRDQQAATEE